MSAGVQGESVARNYAEALLALAGQHNAAESWGALLRQIANAVSSDLQLARFLESPRIAAAQKSEVLAKALGEHVPRLFLRFLQQLVRNRRQMLIPTIADEYETLRDAANGIVHARVTVARAADDEEARLIAERLSSTTGKTVVPHFAVDPAILGGVIVRMGDTVMDGSLRRKLALLRRRMGVQRV